MDELLRLRLAATGGVISARELTDCGVTGHRVRDLVQKGVLVRVRAGAFVDGDAHRSADAVGRHVLATRAVVRRLDGYAAAHLSAVALWGLPVIADDLGPVHVASVREGRARRAGTLQVHPPVPGLDVRRQHGIDVVDVGFAVLQVAADSVRAGLVAADAAVRQRLTSRVDLLRWATEPGRPMRYSACRVADLANGLSESPGESWTRLVLVGLGVEVEQQVEIRDAHGWLVGRVDFLVARRVVVEFDGAVKYEGANGREALVREKRREDALRAMGYRVVRVTWSDLHHPERIAALLRAAGVDVPGAGVGRAT